jgi:hypothetical protein
MAGLYKLLIGIAISTQRELKTSLRFSVQEK